MQTQESTRETDSVQVKGNWEKDTEKLDRLAHLFDAAFRLPVVGVRIGWDSIIGLIPGIGDAIGFVPLAYYIRLARKYNLGGAVYIRLLWNQLVDFVLGSIPLVGDLFDIGWKANLKNAKLLSERIKQMHQTL